MSEKIVKAIKIVWVYLQYILPHHFLSRLFSCFANCRQEWLKNTLIRWFIQYYRVDLSEAEITEPRDYENFSAFFTRSLRKDARPFMQRPQAICSPVDGQISALGDIAHGRIFQAKGFDYSLSALLGNDASLAQTFMGGRFCTFYLAPHNYHRVHMPVAGTLRKMLHVPGRLFSVNQQTVEKIPDIFARNERVICIFDTSHGSVAIILIGAMIVASIETAWAGVVTPRSNKVTTTDYQFQEVTPIEFGKGEQIGSFNLGSTVMMLYPPKTLCWSGELKMGECVTAGQVVGLYEEHGEQGTHKLPAKKEKICKTEKKS